MKRLSAALQVLPGKLFTRLHQRGFCGGTQTGRPVPEKLQISELLMRTTAKWHIKREAPTEYIRDCGVELAAQAALFLRPLTSSTIHQTAYWWAGGGGGGAGGSEACEVGL